MNDWRPGDEYRAHGFKIAFCEDPNCGVHIVALNPNGGPICEIVMSPEQTLRTIEVCKDELYAKAVARK